MEQARFEHSVGVAMRLSEGVRRDNETRLRCFWSASSSGKEKSSRAGR